MRRNLPVTGKEVMLGDGCTIVSKTNTKGVIEEINQDFLDISGFATDELAGKAHNVIRHPDMPEAAFADLWKDLKAERPWIGMVKNRCKNGDHYWVESHFAPRYENGQLIGYMSVRQKATREAIANAEKALAVTGQQAPDDSKLHGRKVLHLVRKHVQRQLLRGHGSHMFQPPIKKIGIVNVEQAGAFRFTAGVLARGLCDGRVVQGALAFARQSELTPEF